MARLGLDRKEPSQSLWSWEPQGAGTRHRPRPLQAQWGVEGTDPALDPHPPRLPLGGAKPPEDLGLLPTTTSPRGLGGGKKTEVPPPAGRVVTSSYHQPVAGAAAHHVIHAPPNPARALPPRSPPSQPDSHLSRLLSPTFAFPAPATLSTAPAPPSPCLGAPTNGDAAGSRVQVRAPGAPLTHCPQIQAGRVRGPRECCGRDSNLLIPPTVG